jgi:hypothetical protein
VLLAIPAIALADNVQNDVDATTEGKIVSVQAGQKSEDVGYRIQATGGDTGDTTGPTGQNCNPARSPVSITINTPTGVTVEKTDGTALTAPQLTFNSCGTFQFVKFAVASTVTPGDYTITVADAGTTYNESPASFTLRVTTPPDTTAPTGAAISIDNAALWTNNASGNVSLALSADDDTGVTSYRLAETEAGLATATPVSVSPAAKNFSASNVSFTLTGSEGEFKEVWLRVCDAQNNCSNASDTIGWDKTNPTISSSADRMDGTTVLGSYVAGTWTNKSVRVSFSCNDALSGVNTTASNIAGNTLTTEGENQSVSSTGSCVDQAGNTNSAGASFSNIDIDKTNPTIDGSASPAPNGAGWNNTNVTVSFNCDDALSGVVSCPADVTLSSDGADQSVMRSVSDNAGNSASDTVGNIDIDKTKPNVQVTGVSNNANYTTGAVPTPDCDTTDGLSGVKTDATVNVTGGNNGFGTFTATCSGAVDNADNAQAAPVSVQYTVSAAFNGFLQPIDGHSVNTGKFGRTYPIKWQLRDSSGALISDSAAQALVTTMSGGQKAVSCTSFDLADTDALEESTTGNTALRYDATSDQFIYNYKAPSSGTCYVFAIRGADGVPTHTEQIDFKFTK